MTVRQKYKIQEYIFGEQTLTVLITDTYGELFLPSEIIDTQIFNFESIKQDLELEDGSYAVDELGFSVSHTACHTADDLKAMYFVLDAASLEVNRYIAVYFGEDLTLENRVFVGKIESKFSGDDKVWDNVQYFYDINPKRDYKMSALSFDISILDDCKMTGKITDNKGNVVDNIYKRLAYSDWAEIKQIFEWRKAYATTGANLGLNTVMFAPLGNLYKVIQLYLDKAEGIITELQNTAIAFNLVGDSFGIKTSPMSYSLVKEKEPWTKSATEATEYARELKLSNFDSGDTWSSIFIHRRMVDPVLGHTGLSENKQWEENMASSEKAYSFKGLANISEMLFGIARCFGCYVRVTQADNYTFNIEFIPRKALVEDEYTFIIGATDAKIDTSSVISDEAQAYYATANNYIADGVDTCYVEYNFDLVQDPTPKWREASENRKENEEKNNIKSERLLLSTSPSKWCLINAHTAPLNIDINTGTPYGWNVLGVATGPEMLHTGIYITLPVFETNFKSYLGANTAVWRPAFGITAKINGENQHFDTLTDYVNYVTARDKQYYETEYEMTVPFWNGFSKTEGGANARWDNIKLGSKIKLGEKVKRYEPKRHWDSITSDSAWIYVTDLNHGLETGDIVEVYGVSPNDFCTGGKTITVTDKDNFYYENVTGYVGETVGGWYVKRNEWADDVTIYREYAVTSIERSLQKPETKIKMQNVERFAYGFWEGDQPAGIIINNADPTLPAPEDGTVVEGTAKGFVIDYGDVLAYDAVMIMDNGKIRKATAESANWGRIRGIALSAGTAGDTIQVQMSGIVKSTSFSFTNLNNPVFVRTNASGLNISQTVLQNKTATEDMIVYLGNPVSSDSFLLNIMEIIIQS